MRRFITAFLTALFLGGSLLNFSGHAHAEENLDNAIHNHEEASHNHVSATHEHGELTESGDIGIMYIPCPANDPNPHHMISMSSTNPIKIGTTGDPHYHDKRYCIAEVWSYRTLYSCKYCGWDEWRTTTYTVHPAL